ncbi:MAG: hypothetical protein JXX14_07300 [Deltaproteobacteria bacterium]|nr:hypothetical protein [Deltaproteobacteria bacterium]
MDCSLLASGPSQLTAIRDAVGNDLSMHVLGFAKAEEIHEFSDLNITSFDTTSPLLRAFKDSNRNYYALRPEGGIDYYSAIRIPQAIDNNGLKNLAKQGIYSQEDLQNREATALRTLRAFDRGEADVQDTLTDVMAYTAPLTVGRDEGHSDKEKRKLDGLRERYQRTLEDRPWKTCTCQVCRTASIETIIFRASNRNKRRGIHNLQAYQKHIRKIGKSDNYA